MKSENEISNFLVGHPLFADVDQAFVGAFASRCRCNVYPSGTLLLKQGQRGDVLMFLQSGTVQFRTQLGSRTTILTIFRPPAVFSLGAIIEDVGTVADALALEAVTIISVDGFVVRDLMVENGPFSAKVATQLSRNVREFIQSVVKQKLLPGPKRLANFLTEEFARQGQTTAIDLPFQRQIIASLLGMTPENLSRAFSVLESHGVSNHRIHVAVESLDSLVAFGRA